MDSEALKALRDEMTAALGSGALFNPEMLGSMLRDGDNPISRWRDSLDAILAASQPARYKGGRVTDGLGNLKFLAGLQIVGGGAPTTAFIPKRACEGAPRVNGKCPHEQCQAMLRHKLVAARAKLAAVEAKALNREADYQHAQNDLSNANEDLAECRAKLAAVERLADEWDKIARLDAEVWTEAVAVCVKAIRAALAATPDNS